MNAKLLSFAIAAALFTATSAFADQPFGRGSVYANPGATFPTAKVAKAIPGNGRGTVTAYELPAPTPKDKVNVAETIRYGRS
jgi:hypothetical protein